MTKRPIITDFVHPPIPVRDFDWSAVFDSYEPGEPIGFGRTKETAIADLLDEADLCSECHGALNDEGECAACLQAIEDDNNSQFGMGA